MPFFAKARRMGGQIANRLIDIHSLQPRILIFQILPNFCGLAVVSDKLTISVPILFSSHTDCQIEGKYFIKLFRVSETGAGRTTPPPPRSLDCNPLTSWQSSPCFPRRPQDWSSSFQQRENGISLIHLQPASGVLVFPRQTGINAVNDLSLYEAVPSDKRTGKQSREHGSWACGQHLPQ